MNLRPLPVHAALFLALLATASAQEPNAKALKYYEVLSKRPGPGAVFDRFYNAWLETGTLEQLEQFLRTAADAPDAPAQSRMLLAFYCARQNEHAKAAAEFAKALEKNPGSAEAWHQKALAESRLLDLTAALASLENALAASPPPDLATEIRKLKGRLLARDGRTDDALKTWQDLLAASPGDAALFEDVIDLQSAEGLNREALATAGALFGLTKDPYQKVQYRLRMGDLHARMGDRDAAVAAYTECLDDTGADSWLEKEILAQIEQVFRRDDAVDAFKTLLDGLTKKYPQRLSLHRRHARLLAETGDADGAVSVFLNLLQIAPGDRTVREAFIDLLAQNKRHEEAVAQMEALIKQAPQDAELPARLAELHHAAGNGPAAKAAVDLFLTGSDQSEAAHLRAAGIMERCAQPDASLALYRATAEKFPSSESAQDALALALHRAGKKDEAAAAWRKLADGADRGRLGNVARSATARDEHALAWDLLIARAADFQEESVFLTQLCDAAGRAGKFAEALPFARRLVNQAKDAPAMEAALSLTLRLAGKAQLTGALLSELAAASTPGDLCLLAELLEKSGRRTEAEAALQKLAVSAPDLAAALQVRLHSARGDDAAAAKVLEALVESPGGQNPVHVQRLVELLSRAGKTDEALRWIPVWKKVAPGAAAPWQREAAIHMEAGRPEEAMKTLRGAVVLFEDNAELKTALASACRADAKFADAMRLYTALYEEAQELPDKIRLAGEMAATAQAAGKIEDLIESLEERRRGNRTSLAPLLSLAEVYRTTENYEARRTTLLEAARIAPDNKDLRLEIIRSAESEGDWDRAIQSLRDLAAADTTGTTQIKLAATLYNAGREPEALKLMGELAASGKVDARGAESMALSLISAQAWPECAGFLAPLISKYPADYRLAYLQAVALEENDDIPGALAAFRRLMTMKDELPAATAVTKPPPSSRRVSPGLNNPRQPVNAAMRLAPELQELQKLIFGQGAGSAYSYRYNGRISVSSSGRAQPSRPSMSLPSSVEELPGFALSHLATLTEDDAASRSAIVTELESSGIRWAADALELITTPKKRNRIDYGELFQRNPDRLIIQLLIGVQSFYGTRMSPDLAVEVAAKLRPSRPQLAGSLILMNLFTSDVEEHQRMFREAMATALAQADSEPASRQAILNFVRSQNPALSTPGGNSISEANKPLMQKARDYLAAQYTGGKLDAAERSSAFYTMVSLFLEKNDTSGLVQFLDQEMAPQSVTPSAGLIYSRRSVSSGSLGVPLGFPSTAGGIPIGILSLFGMEGYSAFPDGYFKPSENEIKDLLPLVKHPVLRVLLAYRSGNHQLVTDSIPALLTGDPPSLTSVMLAAGWLERQEKFTEAAEVLKKAPQPIPPVLRLRFDKALVSWSQNVLKAADHKIDQESPFIKSAREAALRLRTTAAASGSMRMELTAVLTDLGLTEEAARFTAAVPKKQSGTNPSRTATAPQPKERVEVLMKAGKRDEALRLLTRELKDIARNWPQMVSRNTLSEVFDWKKMTEKHGLSEALVKTMDPGNSSDVNAIASWGAVQEIFNGPAEAVEHYRSALDRRPKNQEFHTVWLRAALISNPAGAAATLRRADPAQVNEARNLLSNLSHSFRTVAARAALLEGLNEWLTGIPPESLRDWDLNWVLLWLENFRNNSGGDQQRYGDLRGGKSGGSDSEKMSDEDRALTERWRAAAEHLALTLLKNVTVATSAFSSIASLRNSYSPEADRKDLDTMAADALTLHLAGLKRAQSRQNVFYWITEAGDTAEPWRNLSPGEWLLQRAVEQKRPELIEAVIQQLKASASPDAALLELAAKLNFCPEADFAAAAKAAFTVQPSPRNQDVSVLSMVIRVMTSRNLVADLDTPLLDGVKSQLQSSPSGALSTAIQSYCLHLIRRHGRGRMEAFFAEITAAYLGPFDTRAALIAKEFNPNSWGSHSINGQLHYWLKLCAGLSAAPELSLSILTTLERDFVALTKSDGDTLQFNQPQSPLTSSEFYKNPAGEFMKALAGSTAMAEAAAFDLPVIKIRYSTSYPRDILRAMSGSEEARKALTAAPQTFGTAFLLAGAAQTPENNQLLALLGERAAELEKLPMERQLRIAAIFRASLPERNTGKGASDLIARGKAWLQQLEDREALGTMEKLLAAPRASLINPADNGFALLVFRTLTPLLKTEPEKALQVFLRAREQIAADRKLGTQPVYPSGNTEKVLKTSVSFHGAALATALQQTYNSIPAGDPLLPRIIAAATAMMATDQGCGVESSRDISYDLGGLLTKAGTPPEKDAKFSIERLVATVGPGLKPEWIPALLGPARHAMWTTDIKSNSAAQQWLEQQTKDGPYREFAMLLLTGARIGSQEKDAGNNPRANLQSVEQLPAEQQWLIGQLEKKSAPPAIMAAFAGESLRQWPAAEPPLRLAAMHALAAAWTADVPVGEDYADLIVESFLLLGANHRMPEGEAIKSAAKAAVDAWLTRLAKVPEDRSATYGWQRTQLNDRLLLRRMLYTALITGNNAEGAKIAQTMDGGQSTYFLTPAWPGILVFFKQYDAARNLLRNRAQYFYNYDSDGTRIGWDYKAGVHEALPEFLAGFDNPAERFRSEVILRGLPDVDAEGIGGPLKGKAEPRNGRLLSLAKAWPGEEALKLPDGMMLLWRLLSVPGGEAAMGPVLDSLSKDKPLSTYLPGQQTSYSGSEPEPRIIAAAMKHKVAAGDLPALLQFAEDTFKSGRNGSLPYGNGAMLSAVWMESLKVMKPHWPKWDEAARKSVFELGRQLILDQMIRSAMSNYGENSLALLYVQLYWLSVASGQVDEFNKTIAGPLKVNAPYVLSTIQQMDTAGCLNSLLQPWPEEAPEAAARRSELMLQWIMEHGGELPGQDDDGAHWFRRTIKAGWLRGEDVIAKAEELITLRPRNGTTAIELLEITAAAKQESAFQKVLEKRKLEVSTDATGKSVEQLSNTLHKLKRFKEAAAVLDLLDSQKPEKMEPAADLAIQVPVKRVHLHIEQTAAEQGMAEAEKAAARVLTENPDGAPAWAGVAWAWHQLAMDSRDAGNHEEALLRFSMAHLFSQTVKKFSQGKHGASIEWSLPSCREELKALKRDEKTCDDLTTKAGISRLAAEMGPRWQLLPEAARQRIQDSAAEK